MSTNRLMVKDALQKGPNGRWRCRWCGDECPKPRMTFCHNPEKDCLHQYNLRRDPGYLRECVLQRDHGICSDCGVDTLLLRRELLRLQREDEQKYDELYRGVKWRDRPDANDPTTKYFLLLARLAQVGISYKQYASRLTLWDADHIKPVSEGGGECDLENIRTVCLGCHLKHTRALRARLAGKKKLKEVSPCAKTDKPIAVKRRPPGECPWPD